jgi:hypothetical protein
VLQSTVKFYSPGRNVLVTRASLSAALARAESFLLESPVIEAVLAKREVGQATEEDAEDLLALADELIAHQCGDGSWGDDIGRTAEALLLLGDLLAETQRDERAQRAVEWIRLKQDQPGSIAYGCDEERHRLELCSHALVGGFFAPASPQADLRGRTLSNGLRFPSDPDARVGVSALALRATLRWADPSDSDRQQVASLIQLAYQAFRAGRPQPVGAAAYSQVLATLASAPRTAEITAVLHSALSRMTAMQRADGSWSDLDAFHVLELLLLAIRRGYASPLFDGAIARSAEMLTLTQQKNGSWGSAADPDRLLIGWRALRHAVRLDH